MAMIIPRPDESRPWYAKGSPYRPLLRYPVYHLRQTPAEFPVVTDIATLLKDERPELAAIFERLYPELKRLARTRLAALGPGKTITPTVLVHEAYMRLLKSENLDLQGRRYFFACAGRAMRDIVVDYLRAGSAVKRGGNQIRVTFSEELPGAKTVWGLQDLERALVELAQVDPDQRELVDMRFFAGLSLREIAEITQTPYRTVQRRWQRAKAFLHTRLDQR